MKHFIKLMALSTLLLGGSLALNAQSVVRIIDNPVDMGIAHVQLTNANDYDVRTVADGKIYTPKRAQVPARAEGEITAKIHHEYDPQNFEVYSTQIRDFENGKVYWLYGNDSIITLPAGTYDVFTLYTQYNFTYEDGSVADLVYRFCVLEQVELNEGTVVVTNPEAAMNGPVIQAYNPEGELWRQPTIKVNDDYTEEVLEEGNMVDMFCMNTIIHKATGTPIGINGGNLSSIWVHSGRTRRADETVNRFNVSPLSNRFALITVRVYYTADGMFYYNYLQGEYEPNGVVTNNAEDYVLYEENFKQSPEGMETTSNVSYPFIAIGGRALNGEGMQGWEVDLNVPLVEGGTIKYYVNNVVDGEFQAVPMFNGGFVDGKTIDFIGWEVNHYVYGPNVMQESDGTLIHLNNGSNAFHRMLNDAGSLVWAPLYPGNPVLSYPADNKDYTLNECCPIMVTELIDYTPWYGAYYLYLNKLYGRAGEVNKFDNILGKVTLSVDGELVKEVEEKQYIDWAPTDYEGQQVECVYTIDNVEVDGLAGQNTTTVHFDLTQDADVTPPTVTMLDFVKVDGIMTDRFEYAEDATVRIYAGDFNLTVTELGEQYNECNDEIANIEVSCSPYQQNAWETIAVEEDPDLFYLPGLGQYFSGSLAGVENLGENGWCDLKIRLTDAAGNWQEQVISPAFCIMGMPSSITEVETAADATVIGYYDLQGRQLSAPVKGFNIVLKSDGTASKMIVK